MAVIPVLLFTGNTDYTEVQSVDTEFNKNISTCLANITEDKYTNSEEKIMLTNVLHFLEVMKNKG
jgi:hypothetical protein